MWKAAKKMQVLRCLTIGCVLPAGIPYGQWPPTPMASADPMQQLCPRMPSRSLRARLMHSHRHSHRAAVFQRAKQRHRVLMAHRSPPSAPLACCWQRQRSC